MDIGIQEILLISVLALLILGPERLPQAIKSIALFVNQLKRSFNELKSTIEQEVNADEIRQRIHNENVLHELGETKDALDELDHQLSSQLEVDQTASTHKANIQANDNGQSEEDSPKH